MRGACPQGADSVAALIALRESTSYFFFSSRRRHTRCLSDWSSDVCSSDLIGRLKVGQRAAIRVDAYPGREFEARVVEIAPQARSEERRVGKEWRTGGWTKH